MLIDAISLLAHVTPNDAPAGVAVFLAGVGTGIGLSMAAYWKFFRSR